MARYDDQGYRNLPRIDTSPRRQILGYSRAVQGGADEARARANQRIAEGWNPSLRLAAQRARNVAMAKASGTFDATREAYNEAGQKAGVEMDEAGNISRQPTPTVMAKPYQYVPPRPASATPRIFRPASQMVEETVGMTTGQGLLDMARKARRKGTYVIQ